MHKVWQRMISIKPIQSASVVADVVVVAVAAPTKVQASMDAKTMQQIEKVLNIRRATPFLVRPLTMSNTARAQR
jgi:hypothetical protein